MNAPLIRSNGIEHAGRAWRKPRLIDWERYRAVVFESDDWGSCEQARHAGDLEAIKSLHSPSPWLSGTLEAPQDLERLYQTLEAVRGADGQSACFTAFLCVANPNYDAIRSDRFERYHEIPVHLGFPDGWERGNLLEKWREGTRRGTFAFEYHTRLHHTQPAVWLERLRAGDAEGKRLQRLFDLHCFAVGAHLPEYQDMTARQQHHWIQGGVQHFVDTFGHAPRVAATSDATPLTEVIWTVNGIRTFTLKNARLNSGEVVVYHTKPWNSQDAYCPMGGYNPNLDMVYLGRNVQFECGVRTDGTHAADAALPAVLAAWQRNEPAIINTHRVNYVSLAPEVAERSHGELVRLLNAVAERQAHFLTSAEVGDLYRQGYSVRPIDNKCLIRNWSTDMIALSLSLSDAKIISLSDGREFHSQQDDAAQTTDLPPGNYLATASQTITEKQVACASL